MNATGGIANSCAACCGGAAAAAPTLGSLLAVSMLTGGVFSPPFARGRTQYTLQASDTMLPPTFSLTTSGAAPVLAECWGAPSAANWLPTSLTVVPLSQQHQFLVTLPPVSAPMTCEFILGHAARLTLLALPPAAHGAAAAAPPLPTADCEPPAECEQEPAPAANASQLLIPDREHMAAVGEHAAAVGEQAAAGAAPPDDEGVGAMTVMLGLAAVAGGATLAVRWNRYHRAWSREQLMSGLGIERETDGDGSSRDMAYHSI